MMTTSKDAVVARADEAERAAIDFVNALALFIGQIRILRHLTETMDANPADVLRDVIAVPPARQSIAEAAEEFDRTRKEIRRAVVDRGVEFGESLSEMARLLGLSKQYSQRLHTGQE